MNNIFTKKEITLLLFILGGLASGFVIDSFLKQGENNFPEQQAPIEVVDVDSSMVEMVEELTKADIIKPEPSGPVDINRACKEQLLHVNSIGPVLADRIIEDRKANGPYHKPEDLLRVKGIGSVTLSKIKPQIIVEQ
ncbi:helix-hairpin-helix domain-containing protein [bacterium]|nr:helix-hairpin-helix domain-containing protein [bacterium]